MSQNFNQYKCYVYPFQLDLCEARSEKIHFNYLKNSLDDKLKEMETWNIKIVYLFSHIQGNQ